MTETRGAAPRRRRIWRALLLVLWVWLLVELGSFAGVWALQGERPSYARQRARQEAQAALEVRGNRVEDQPGNARDAWTRGEVRHPYLGFVSRPHGKLKSRRLSHHNGLVLSDPDAPPFREELFVVGLTGGSVAAAVITDAWELLAERIAATPALAGREVHVFNFANAGFKQPQQLINLSYLLSVGVRFDAVINLDGFNEIALYQGRPAQLGAFPAYPRAWAQRQALSESDLALNGRLGVLEQDRADAAHAMLACPGRFSWLRQLAWTWTDRGHAQRVGLVLAELDARAQEGAGELELWERLGPRKLYTDLDDSFPDLAAIWERSSRSMAALCHEAGAVYVHALQPNQYDGESKPMGAEERRVALNFDVHYSQAVPKGYPLLRAAGERLVEAGISFHDLGQLFAGVEEQRYKDDCCHFNAAGSSAIAEALAAAVIAGLP